MIGVPGCSRAKNRCSRAAIVASRHPGASRCRITDPGLGATATAAVTTAARIANHSLRRRPKYNFHHRTKHRKSNPHRLTTCRHGHDDTQAGPTRTLKDFSKRHSRPASLTSGIFLPTKTIRRRHSAKQRPFTAVDSWLRTSGTRGSGRFPDQQSLS